MSGTPMGTAPRLSASTWAIRFSTVMTSMTDIVNSRIPPAIRKSATVMPRYSKIQRPSARNARATTSAVIIDWTMTFRTACRSTPSVRCMNSGRIPTASTATNMGKKHNQKSAIRQ